MLMLMVISIYQVEAHDTAKYRRDGTLVVLLSIMHCQINGLRWICAMTYTKGMKTGDYSIRGYTDISYGVQVSKNITFHANNYMNKVKYRDMYDDYQGSKVVTYHVFYGRMRYG